MIDIFASKSTVILIPGARDARVFISSPFIFIVLLPRLLQNLQNYLHITLEVVIAALQKMR